MIKFIYKSISTAVILLAISSPSYSWAPYIGASANTNAQISNSGGGGSVFGGYETSFGENKNLYLAGELNLDAGHYSETRNTIGIGASILPGINLSKDTTLYARLGLESFQYKYDGRNNNVASTVGGLGISTLISKPWGIRFEYIGYNSRIGNTYNLGFIYKLK